MDLNINTNITHGNIILVSSDGVKVEFKAKLSSLSAFVKNIVEDGIIDEPVYL